MDVSSSHWRYLGCTPDGRPVLQKIDKPDGGVAMSGEFAERMIEERDARIAKLEAEVAGWRASSTAQSLSPELMETIRAEEREKVAQWALREQLATGHADTLDDLLAELSRQLAGLRARIAELEAALTLLGAKEADVIRAEEREACAVVCDEIADDYWAHLSERDTKSGGLLTRLREKGHQVATDCAAAIRARGEKK